MQGYRSLRDFDWPMVILASAICSLGVLQIFSATHDTSWAGAWWKQVVWVLAGFIAMWFATLIDYHTLLGQDSHSLRRLGGYLDRDLRLRNDGFPLPALDRNNKFTSAGVGIR
jgi:hypothetical protein